MSDYSENLYEIEYSVFGEEIIGELFKWTLDDGYVVVKAVQVGLPDGVKPTDYNHMLNALITGWTNFAREAFDAEGWTGEFAPPLIVEWDKIYIYPLKRPTYRVPVKVSYDYIELITEVSV